MKFSKDMVKSSFDSPLGPMTLAANPTKLAGVWFNGQSHQPDSTLWPVDNAHPVLREAQAQLANYFVNPQRPFNLALDLSSGTPFQQAVWLALMEIPVGKTSSYGRLGSRIGKPAAIRAVGGAVGRNPFCIILPCHRVIGAGGALTGYAGGLERKIALLQSEGAL